MPDPEAVSQLDMASSPALILASPGPYMANSWYCSTEGAWPNPTAVCINRGGSPYDGEVSK